MEIEEPLLATKSCPPPRFHTSENIETWLISIESLNYIRKSVNYISENRSLCQKNRYYYFDVLPISAITYSASPKLRKNSKISSIRQLARA